MRSAASTTKAIKLIRRRILLHRNKRPQTFELSLLFHLIYSAYTIECASHSNDCGVTEVIETVMLGLGYAGGLFYLVAYLCLTKGWISGTGYTFHSISVVSCVMIAASSSYSAAWPSAVLNVIFVGIGIGYLMRKAYVDAKQRHTSITNVSALTFQADRAKLEAAA